jgi:hypothetical protein
MEKTNQKLWIFGDSFNEVRGEHPWQKILYKNFLGKDVYASGKGSRDLQTVFDIFLQKLQFIKPEDFVIIFFPTLIRFRLPLENPYVDVAFSNDICGDLVDGTNKQSMIGNPVYVSIMSDMSGDTEMERIKNEIKLEYPLNEIDPQQFAPMAADKKPNFANITEFINTSSASVNNWNIILKSIQSYVPFKLLYYSWTNELDSNIVDTKSVITNDLGMWHTLMDEYNETSGKSGEPCNVHWSDKMSYAFAMNIIKKYPEYFKTDIE